MRTTSAQEGMTLHGAYLTAAGKPYQPCGYGENASMFLAMRFLHSGKIMLCGKGSAQD